MKSDRNTSDSCSYVLQAIRQVTNNHFPGDFALSAFCLGLEVFTFHGEREVLVGAPTNLSLQDADSNIILKAISKKEAEREEKRRKEKREGKRREEGEGGEEGEEEEGEKGEEGGEEEE